MPTNGIKRTEYYETIRLGVSFSIGAPTNEFVYVSHNDGEMMIYVDSTGIVTKIFSSADKIIGSVVILGGLLFATSPLCIHLC